MSTILRMTKFMKKLNIGDWRLTSLFYRTSEKVLLETGSRLCSTSAAVNSSSTFYANKTYSTNNIETLINEANTRIQTMNTVSQSDINHLLHCISSQGTLTKDQALYLLRFCTYIGFNESLETRKTLCNDVWNIITKLKTELDISYYNALLEAYLENQIEFLPNDILSELKEKNISPNHVTFQRLIEQFCKNGDIENTTKILEIMNNENIPINEIVFDSLIKGHAVSGNEANALNVINIMRNAGIEPKSTTYTEILCMYAKSGKIEVLKSTLTECEKKYIVFTSKDIMEIIYTLALNNHSQYISEFIPRLRRSAISNKLLVQYINLLIEKQLLEEASIFYDMLSLTQTNNDMLSPPQTSNDIKNYGNFFVKKMVVSNTKLEKIIDYCRKLSTKSKTNKHFEYAIFTCYCNNMHKLALPLIKEYHERGGNIREQYFFPLLLSCKNNEKDLQMLLQEMQTTFQITPQNETLTTYVIPHLKINYDEQVNFLLEAGLSFSKSVISVLHSLFKSKKTKDACKLMTQLSINCELHSLYEVITLAILDTKDVDSLIKILSHQNTRFKLNNRNRNINNILVHKIITKANPNDTIIEEILSGLVKKNLSINSAVINKITYHIGNNLSSSVEKYLQELKLNELKSLDNSTDTTSTDPKLINLKNNIYMNDTEAVEKSIKNLEEENFWFSPEVSEYIMNYFLQIRNLEQSKKWIKHIYENHDQHQINIDTLFDYASVLIFTKNLNDAIKVFENTKMVSIINNSNTESMKNFFKILNAKYPDEVINIFKILDNRENISRNRSFMNSLYKLLLNSNNENALKLFEWMYQNHKETHHVSRLLKNFINDKDTDSLQRLMDTYIEAKGKYNALFNLGIFFIECQKPEEAKKIFLLDQVIVRSRLVNIINKYVKQNDVQFLEQLTEVLESNCKQIEEVYYSLVYLYEINKNLKKCKSLLTRLKGDNISYGFIEYIKGVIIKLETSETDKTDTKFIESPAKIHLESIATYLENNKTEEATNMINNYVQIHFNKSQKSDIKQLIYKATQQFVNSNDFVNIEKLTNELKTKKIKLHGVVRNFNEYCLDQNKYNDLLTYLENLIDKSETEIDLSHIFNIEVASKAIMKEPEIEEKLKNVAYKAIEKNEYGPMNALWLVKVLTDNSEMETIWNTHLENHNFFGNAASYTLRNFNQINKFPFLCEKILDNKNMNNFIKKKCFATIFDFIKNSDDLNKYKLLHECLLHSLKILQYNEINQNIIAVLKENLGDEFLIESLKEASNRNIQSVAI